MGYVFLLVDSFGIIRLSRYINQPHSFDDLYIAMGNCGGCAGIYTKHEYMPTINQVIDKSIRKR